MIASAKVNVEFNESEFIRYFNAQADNIYQELAEKCATYAVDNINSHTGNLKLSIKAKKSKFENGGWICVADSKKGPHAFLVEYGTAGPRKPLRKKYMRFEIDGQVIFAKVVAPMPARPFMRPARDRAIADLKQSVR